MINMKIPEGVDGTEATVNLGTFYAHSSESDAISSTTSSVVST